ncbi:MAG: DNA-directed RNA polymerase subunit beta' [Phycisphaerales bacterium]|nr:DNA-directed RNA polymerase subunit beta' [Phycisphaerales bacterium]
MAESVFDRVNDYGAVRIQLASPNDIRSWSFGEVKKPETINYRTYRPERDGLFCERIFGPERDYECACGKYKGTKYKGIICDRCGVKVTHSRVRRKRMGHINLAAPAVHIWFFKALPSRLGTLLGMRTGDIEKVVYFQDYVVTDPGSTDLKFKQVLTDDEYREMVAKHGGNFTAMMGAEAIRELLSPDLLDLAKESAEIRQELAETKSKQKNKDLSKRLKLIEQIRGSKNEPQWMVLDVIPVIPPQLRPLVLLQSGNFATSDLNDLYRRIINRNNRLKKLMDLNAPEVIIRNEKRMLQQAVDALFDNGRCRRPVLGSSNRPLKSITDMIKGKQGRFRENLLGKRVDYSARSVIVVGPELKLWQCGLPKKIALELFQPFIIRKLKEHGLADTIKSAKRMLERRAPEVWDILEQVTKNHPVLLNRAPTLHRMGIQAFEPVLVEGNAIKIHPLVCAGYNADFDGDQMAVHLPLSLEAQIEASVLMMSTHNIFSPANGNPIVSPSQDIVMGVYFLTAAPIDLPVDQPGKRSTVPCFGNVQELLLAHDLRKIGVHEWIDIRLDRFSEVVNGQTESALPSPAHRRIRTTVGRVLFSEILATGLPFYNCSLGKKGSARVIDDTFARNGKAATIELLDALKETGFKASTTSGLSFGITDLNIPKAKEKLIADSQKKVDAAQRSFDDGNITDNERRNHVMDAWSQCRDGLSSLLMETFKTDRRTQSAGTKDVAGNVAGLPSSASPAARYLNPVYLFMDSGARGNKTQMQQLAGMRGQMAKPSGEIMETPIKSNFREGLSVIEYFSSTHGARKGLSDTALKTADSGYLTRKLCDVAQSVVVIEHDCGEKVGIAKEPVYKGEEVDVPLRDIIKGRTSCESIVDPRTDRTIVAKNEIITADKARLIEELGQRKVWVRSPLTCLTSRGVCATCYGMDMSTGKLVEEGLAVGIIAAQSIGEPGTQLTMRTFHTGGIAVSATTENQWKTTQAGTIEFVDCGDVQVVEGDRSYRIAIRKTGEVRVMDAKGRALEQYKVPYGALLMVAPGEQVKKGHAVLEWDVHVSPILAEKSGTIRFRDIEAGETVRVERKANKDEMVVIEHKGEKHPRLTIEDESGKVLDLHHLPAKAHVEVKDGQVIMAGQRIAYTPKGTARSADIVGGLPRVTEIFEARIPRDPAVLAKISGRIELLPNEKRGKMTIRIHADGAKEELAEDHYVLQGKRLLVHSSDVVEAGDPLTEGALTPTEILAIKGLDELYRYMLTEVQNVYRAQGVPISDKHIEVVLRQMVSKVRVVEPGDTALLPNDVVERYVFVEVNEALDSMLRIEDAGGTTLVKGTLASKDEIKLANIEAELAGKAIAKTRRPKRALARRLLLGITKASLQSESFLSGASFQETTKVLTEAALKGAVDTLVGLKENVLLGHLIPAGTGFEAYTNLSIKYLVENVGEEFSEVAEMEAAASAAEALGADRIGSAPTIKDLSAHAPKAELILESSDGSAFGGADDRN